MADDRFPHIASLILLLSFSIVAALIGVPLRAQTPRTLAVVGGTIVDVRTGKLIPNSVILIQEDRITQVGTVGNLAVPPDARTIKADGKFVMPGLWDSHQHTRDFDGLLDINHGVTSVMDMGNVLDWIVTMADVRAKGLSYGPRIFPDGMVIGGRLGPHEWNVKTPEQARWAAQTNIEAGVAFLKVYQEATPEIVKVAAEEAHKAG